MKALEKDRSRRYETANGLALDIQRYLDGEAVQAAPPGFAYRFKKFVRRHKGPVMAGAAVGAALLIGVVGFAWQAHIVQRERDTAVAAQRAEAAQRKIAEDQRAIADKQKSLAVQEAARATAMNSFMEQMFSAVDPEQEGARGVTVLELLSKASENADKTLKDQPQIEAAARTLLGNTFRSLGRMKEAGVELERALALRKGGVEANTIRHAETLRALGLVLQEKGQAAEALRLNRRGTSFCRWGMSGCARWAWRT
jgi:tetratricopeptide (TPR) repeat protein